MADAEAYNTKSQRPVGLQVQANSESPSKLYTHFLYKAIIVIILLVVVPLLPSQAPEFINRTLHTRSWELLQLILVGIAVSYGLLSKRNDETEKEHVSKFDNAQSYVSRLLQVSSVFDNETDNSCRYEGNKIHTWNSQYHRGEPVVVLAQESSVFEEQKNIANSQIREKPMLLPVRSLKSRVPDSDVAETSNEASPIIVSLSRSGSNSGSKSFSSNLSRSRNGEFGGSGFIDMEQNVEANVVLRSPIPWRSRSGRIEMKEDFEGCPLYFFPPSMDDSKFNPLESPSSQSSYSLRPNLTSSSPNKISPSPSLPLPQKVSPWPSFSLESHAKNMEDLVRKKIYHKSSQPPPPAPPPPSPPSFLRKPPLTKLNPESKVSSEKELRRNVRSMPKEMSRTEREEMLTRTSSGSELKPRIQTDGSLMANSVRTIRSTESVKGSTRARENGEDLMIGKGEKRSKEVEADFVETTGRISRSVQENLPAKSKQPTREFTEDRKQEFLDMAAVETDDEDSESEVNDFEEIPKNEAAALPNNAVGDEGPDVDKKADEFIAKFREQIRLQRIASTRRSTGQIAINSLR